MNLSIANLLYDNSSKDFSEKDYYSGGKVMPGRNLSSTTYEFGYQGSLKDDEVKSSGNSYSTLFREHDPHINQWWSIDPEYRATPWESPYASMTNNPVLLNDVLGNSTDDWVRGKNGKERYDPDVKKPSDVKDGDTYIGPTLPISPVPIGYNLFPNSNTNQNPSSEASNNQSQNPPSEASNNQSQNQTALSQTISLLPLKNVQIYGRVNLKLVHQQPDVRVKMVVPFGLQFAGKRILPVTPLKNTYFTYGVIGLGEIRYMPGQTDISSGEYMPIRGLGTIWTNGLVKVQGEVSAPSLAFEKLQFGNRVAIDQLLIPVFKDADLYFEVSAGFRGTINPISPIFWSRSFVFF